MGLRLPVEQRGDRRPKTVSLLARRPEIRRDLDIARSLGLTLREFDRLPASEREYWIADWELKRLTCSDCGNPFDECSDPKRAWYPYRRVCYATMEREAAEARYTELHEDAPYHDGTFKSWAKERSRAHPYHFNAGVGVGVAESDLAPHDAFTTRVDASPLPPSPHQVEGDVEQPNASADEAGPE